ncbi:hypothetical protein ACGFXB_46460 [Streptomyces canus]|uniref:hypothetical protein n=1 Tax=Streptomyces canus TaxID=58343 RepID=UPI00370F8063
MCAADKEVREDAWRRLFSNIHHHGTRGTASTHAVPFLARIAKAGPQPTRPTALLMLSRLAIDWHEEYDLPGGIDTVAWRAVAAEFTPGKMVARYDGEFTAEEDPDRRRSLQEARTYCTGGGTPDSRASALVSYDAVRAGSTYAARTPARTLAVPGWPRSTTHLPFEFECEVPRSGGGSSQSCPAAVLVDEPTDLHVRVRGRFDGLRTVAGIVPEDGSHGGVAGHVDVADRSPCTSTLPVFSSLYGLSAP